MSGDALATVLGATLLNRRGDYVSSAILTETRRCQVVGVFVSAGWVPDAKAHTDALLAWYSRFRASKHGSLLEIVYVSQDRCEKDFVAAFEHMPWFAVPFASRMRVLRHLPVDALPSLVLLDGQGQIITARGRQVVQNDPSGSHFPWNTAEYAPSAAQRTVTALRGGLQQLLWLLWAALWQVVGWLQQCSGALGAWGTLHVKRGTAHFLAQLWIVFKSLLWFLLTAPWKLLVWLWQRRKPAARSSAASPSSTASPHASGVDIV
eukprot:m.35914 g.35914  ORF g.35914 m.35914 type:complete len:263 (-) comp13327_c0_seq2:58-846(-)